MRDKDRSETGCKDEDFERQVYQLLLFYKQFIQLLGSIFGGYLMITSDEINMIYLRLCRRIEEILANPGFEDLTQLDWCPLENLRSFPPDFDIDWQYTWQPICGDFLSAIEEIFIDQGEKMYPLGTDDQELLAQIQSYMEAYTDHKKMVEAKWLERVERRGRELEGEFGVKSTSHQTISIGSDIFIVHGHDESAKQSVARFIERLELRAVILHEQPNAGRTIIEKFEEYSNVGFAVVLLTPDDIGYPKDKPDEGKPRSRQNVIFELGFFVGKLGRERVCALYKEGVEVPSDFQGVLYVEMDTRGGWRLELVREIKHVGIEVDMNKVV
jgi:predicted nucleotide-binding protein